MRNADVAVPPPVNEPVLAYAPGSPERAALDAEVARQRDETIEIPVVVGGERIETGDLVEAVCPHDHGHVLAKVHRAGEAEIRRAIDAAIEARREWCRVSPETRAAVFLRAAEIVTGPARMALNAATMLNQSKTCHQAEIEAACEQADFYRFNCAFMQEIYASMQPPVSPAGISSSRAGSRARARPRRSVSPSIRSPRGSSSSQMARASAALAASIFHYGEATVGQVKRYLRRRGVPVRL